MACTLDLIGDRWTLLVIRDLLAGMSHFSEFAGAPEKIASNVLADRLDRLLDTGIVEQFPSRNHPGRREYRLTPKGRQLRPVLKAVAKWGLEHIEGTEARIQA